MISNASLHRLKEKIYKMGNDRLGKYNDPYMVGYYTAIELTIAYIDLEIASNESENKIESIYKELKGNEI